MPDLSHTSEKSPSKCNGRRRAAFEGGGWGVLAGGVPRLGKAAGRRLLFGVALGVLPLSRALAASEGNGGGNGNSGNGNSGNGNSGNGNSGNGNSGNGNSGTGNPGNGNSGNGNSGNGNSGGNNGSGNEGKDKEKGSKGEEQAGASEETAQDQDRALEAVEEGRALPLSAFLPRIERKFGGRVIDAALREVGKRLLTT